MPRRGGQNRSSAVMQQRQEARDSLDDFPTPPWATRACIAHVLARYQKTIWAMTARGLEDLSATDPCCNRGHMIRPLAEAFGRTRGIDVHDYTCDPLLAEVGGAPFQQDGIGDFLMPGWETLFARAAESDFFFLNPPFRLAEAFIQRALQLARVGVAVFVRSAFAEGHERYATLFRDLPPTVVAQHAERVILHKGVLRDPAKHYWKPEANNGRGGWVLPSTSTSYSWLVWMKGRVAEGGAQTAMVWIPPCRKRFERAGDYPANPDQKGVFTPPAPAGQGGLEL